MYPIPICCNCEFLKETEKEGCKFPKDRISTTIIKRSCSGFKQKTNIVREIAKELSQKWFKYRD